MTSPGADFSTIPDLLRLAPGMDVARVNSYTWAVGARGLNNQYAGDLLVLQDGRSLYTPVYGGVFWNTVDYVLQDLDRIEVIRGPGATLWGSNARQWRGQYHNQGCARHPGLAGLGARQ